MRINSRFSLQDREGETRIRRKYLIKPRTFDSERTRWFEWAWITEKIVKLDVGGSMEWGKYSWQWREVGFTSEPEGLPKGTAVVCNERGDEM